MDFLKILKSFEDFVYEALIWLVLVPRTLLRIVLSPRRMAEYADRELASTDEERFGDAISPPLLLILCVFLAHLVDLMLRTQVADTSGSLAGTLLASEQNLLLYRTIAFGVWALAGALIFLVGIRRPISRQSLRSPFYEQCYLVAPFALVLSVAMSVEIASDGPSVPAALTVLAATFWFWGVQYVWIRHRMQVSWWRGLLGATLVLVAGAGVNAVVGMALKHPGATPVTAIEAEAEAVGE